MSVLISMQILIKGTRETKYGKKWQIWDILEYLIEYLVKRNS